MDINYDEFVALSVGIEPGHAEFIDCPADDCFTGVVGKCHGCEGFFLKCGCKVYDIACICGHEWEHNDPLYRVFQLETQVAELETELKEARAQAP